MEPILFPDAIAVTVAYLEPLLDDPVRSKVPNPRPERFYTVTRTGGPRRNLVTDEPQLTVESWAQSDEDAADMAQLARAHLNAAPGEVVDGAAIYRSTELSGPARLPDPLSDQPRYSQSFSIAIRGAVLTGS